MKMGLSWPSSLIGLVTGLWAGGLPLADGKHVPLWSLNVYTPGSFLPLYYNKIFSDTSALQYAYAELPFVCPTRGSKHLIAGIKSGSSIFLNLGEILRGDRVTLSDFDLAFGKSREMQYVCTVTIDERNLYWMQALIRDNYRVDWMLDDLPAASVHLGIDGRRRISSAGFPLGYQKTGRTPGESKYFVYNHVALNVRYRVAGNGVSGTQMVVTGVEAYTKSIQHDWKASNLSFEGSEIAPPLELSLAEEPSQNSAFRDDRHFSIPYSYSVYFGKEDDDSIWWPNRWDKYLDGREEPLLRMAVIYAVLVALATFLLKTAATRLVLAIRYSAHIRILRKIGILRRQSSSSNDLGKAETALKESLAAWKLIHRDVFRIPPSAPLLAPLVGSGMQLLFVVAEILLLGANGMFDPNTRGMIISVGIFLFVITGFGSGRTSAQLYKSLGGHLWLFNLLMTGILVPGLFYTTLFIINLFVWTQAASTAIPFGTLIVLLALWLGVQLPLVYLGGLVGHRVSKAWEHPIQPSSTPRRIPQQRWTLRNPQFILLGGIIPLSVIGVAQIYIFHGLLPSANIDFSYGAAGIILFCLVLTTVHITIIGIWLQLLHENYDWWWQSFQLGGSPAIWLFAYSAWHWLFKSQITGIGSTILFFSYSALVCAVYWLVFGALGFTVSYAFVRKIYGTLSPSP